MSEIRVDSIGNESNTGGPVLSGITTFSGQQYFIPPKGTTAERPSDCPPGSIRFNTDSAHLEYWNGLVWLEFEASSVELGDQNNTNSSGGTGTRAFFAGGQNPSNTDIIDYVTIATLGDAQDFGDITDSKARAAACASNVTGIIAGGYTSGFADKVEKITIASAGIDASDATANLSQARNRLAGHSNQTRGVFLGGNAGSDGVFKIDFITITSTANAVDFGNLTVARQGCRAVGSAVRGICAGGQSGSSPFTYQNVIDYVTISSTGYAQEFGDLSRTSSMEMASATSPIRGIFAGGYNPSSDVNVIEFITIATLGNASDFGDLSVARSDFDGTSSSTRAIFGGGKTPSLSDVVDYVTILTTGNASDFGNLTSARKGAASSSNGHGGL